MIRVPKKNIALLSDFEEKRDKIARAAMDMNITNISGVPSWMLSVLNRVMELKGVDRFDEVWPNLEVFFHGGVAFTPYREQYKNIIGLPNMHYMETYNASEGFFGLQNDLSDPNMLLMIDYGIFYEFCPMDNLDHNGYPIDESKIVPPVGGGTRCQLCHDHQHQLRSLALPHWRHRQVLTERPL